MERTLFVMRHAKSARDTGDIDHERPLNGRGRRDAFVAAAVLERALDRKPLDRVLSSTSTRTHETWERVQDGGLTATKVTFHDDIYESSPDDVLPHVWALPQSVTTALVLGHFPCVEELVRRLAPHEASEAWARLDTKFPTSAIATLTFTGDWTGLDNQVAHLKNFVIPRADDARAVKVP